MDNLIKIILIVLVVYFLLNYFCNNIKENFAKNKKRTKSKKNKNRKKRTSKKNKNRKKSKSRKNKNRKKTRSSRNVKFLKKIKFYNQRIKYLDNEIKELDKLLSELDEIESRENEIEKKVELGKVKTTYTKIDNRPYDVNNMSKEDKRCYNSGYCSNPKYPQYKCIKSNNCLNTNYPCAIFDDKKKNLICYDYNNNTSNNCNLKKPYDSPLGGCACLGSRNIVMTDQGEKLLGELQIGDRILVSDDLYSTVCHIRNHGYIPFSHIKFTLSDDKIIIITSEHLVYNQNHNLVCAKKLQIGDKIYGSNSIITNIEIVDDIPLTPIVVEGYINISGKKISCWSGTEENAFNLNKLMIYVKKALKNGMTVENLSKQIHDVYEMYYENGKQLDEKIDLIAKLASQQIPIIETTF